MLVLAANLGSTSFKYKLYDLSDVASPRQLGSGSADRIGQTGGAWTLQHADQTQQGQADFPDHADAASFHMDRLVEYDVIESVEAIEAIGFKAVHGGPIRGAVEVDDPVLETMQKLAPLAPAHNPPYLAAMRAFKQKLPNVRQVAAFETAFHATIPQSRQVYGAPHEWIEQYGVRRYGFHGTSNAYIAQRMTTLAPKCRKIINFHLGGSASVCAIRDGKSAAHSMGATPQTGLFHANRVGDFDAFAVLALIESGMDVKTIYDTLSKKSGWLGLSGVSADLRDVEQAAVRGDERAQLAIDAFVESCRHYLGAYLAVLNGADALVFTAGIGQHSSAIRQAVCADLEFAGVVLNRQRNAEANGQAETRVDESSSSVQIWVVPTDEEWIVARQTATVLHGQTMTNPL